MMTLWVATQGRPLRGRPCVGNEEGMSWETTDVLSADTTDVLSADTTDVSFADTRNLCAPETTLPQGHLFPGKLRV